MKLRKLFKPLAAILIVGGTFAFVRSSFWTVRQVDCRRDGQPCSFEVWSGIFSQLNNQNWLLLSPRKFAEQLAETYPVYSSVRLTKRFPTACAVDLVTRTPVLAVNRSGQYYLLDKEGLVLGTADNNRNLPDLSLDGSETYRVGQTAADVLSVFTARLLAECRWRLLSPVAVEPEGKWSVRVRFSEGTVGVFSVQKDIALQLDSLQFILGRTKMEGKLPERVDLRFDKPVLVE